MLRIPLVVLVALVLCAPAQAATTVARNGAFTLDARQTGGRICVALRHSGHLQGARCGRIPRSPQRALSVNPNFGYAYAAAVPRSVCVAEAESTKGVASARSAPSAAEAFAARFVLILLSRVVRLLRAVAAAARVSTRARSAISASAT